MTLALGTAACANPFAPDVPEVSSEPLPGLSERPRGEPTLVPGAVPVDDKALTTATSVASPTAPVTAPGASTATLPPEPSPSTTAPSEPGSQRQTALPTRVDDAAGDAGFGAPDYADGRLLFVEDLGSDARVTVRMAASLPDSLAPKEVIGIGVDFHRTGGAESDYQLFADGGSDGWRAFLQTPAGFVKYEGAFRVSGDSVQFEVPWSSLGGSPTGGVKAFADWGKPNVAGVIIRSEDALPDQGTRELRG